MDRYAIAKYLQGDLLVIPPSDDDKEKYGKGETNHTRTLEIRADLAMWVVNRDRPNLSEERKIKLAAELMHAVDHWSIERFEAEVSKGFQFFSRS